jgi:TRAP-type C4-dicarboxylate transport system substrate-binding protein
MNHTRSSLVKLITCIATLAITGAGAADASAPPAQPDRIPDGSYTRVATVEDGIALGLDPDVAMAMTGPDGEITTRFVIDGDRYEHHVTNDLGVEELGDLGTNDYDDEGHWVATSESSGCRGCVVAVDWRLTDGELILRFAEDGAAAEDRFIIEGTYVYEPAVTTAETTTPADTVTLRFASIIDDTPAQIVAYLVEVQRLSGGTIEFEFRTNYGGAATGPYSDAERITIDDVGNGTIDAGWVGARALPAFDALHAPLLVDSHDLQVEVFAAGIPQRMAETLDEPGVVGLAVLPGPLRRLVGVDRPLLTPEDFSGQVIAGDASPMFESTMTALGATTVPGVQGQSLEGLDGLLAQFSAVSGNGYHTTAAAVTANLNLWPRPLVVLINEATYESLTPEQQAAFADAAPPAIEPALEASRQEDTSASDLCDAPIDVVEATADELASMGEALKPIYDDLAADPRTADDLAEITAIKDELDVAPDTLTCPDGDA